MEQDRRRLSIRESRAVRLGISVAVFATLSLIALVAVGMVKGPESSGPPIPANTQQRSGLEANRPLTSFDFIQSSNSSGQSHTDDDYPKSSDGMTLPQQYDR
ncbi:MAG: hypothetical protein QF898_07375 [SAR202 cluster bacterium]|nr:hypothetical protein [SAR202 cluster bacterium]MDP6514915.1 hypothetical protein [SAR202 cluster bacterium]MDP6714561.1 hypothetical protein [SAR202 cluster bacterium]